MNEEKERAQRRKESKEIEGYEKKERRYAGRT